MRLKFVTIGQNLKWPRGRLSVARKKNKGIYDSCFSSCNKICVLDMLRNRMSHFSGNVVWEIDASLASVRIRENKKTFHDGFR